MASSLILTFLCLFLGCEAFERVLVPVTTAFGVGYTNVKNAFTAVFPESSDPLVSLEISFHYWDGRDFGCFSGGGWVGGNKGVVTAGA